MLADSYKTIKNIGEGYYTEKRSKFFAYAHHVESPEEVKELLAVYRKKYYDARHVCWAYRLGPAGEEFRMNDDGEPSSTAGKPIHGQLVSHDLTDIVVFVIRYYGGVNLGTSGLIIAYREATIDALNNVEVEERLVETVIEYSFPYAMMNGVMKVVKDLNPRIVDQVFDNTCTIKLAIRESMAEQLQSRLDKLSFE
ncbi:MAG: YigZ family protein [Prevotellaceae bacterium]|nr:YigZ family protein [Prevotellaceae bacterium]